MLMQVTIYGFNEKVGTLSYQDRNGQDQFKKPYSEATAQMIDEEVLWAGDNKEME